MKSIKLKFTKFSFPSIITAHGNYHSYDFETEAEVTRIIPDINKEGKIVWCVQIHKLSPEYDSDHKILAENVSEFKKAKKIFADYYRKNKVAK